MERLVKHKRAFFRTAYLDLASCAEHVVQLLAYDTYREVAAGVLYLTLTNPNYWRKEASFWDNPAIGSSQVECIAPGC